MTDAHNKSCADYYVLIQKMTCNIILTCSNFVETSLSSLTYISIIFASNLKTWSTKFMNEDRV